MKATSLTFMTENDKVDALNILPIDKLTDLLELLSDDEFKNIIICFTSSPGQKSFVTQVSP